MGSLCLSKHPNDRRCGQEPFHYRSVVPGPGALAAGLLGIQSPGLFPRVATWGRSYLLSSPWGCRPSAGRGIPRRRGRSEGRGMCHLKMCVPLWHIDHFKFKVLTLLCLLKAAGGSPTGRVPPHTQEGRHPYHQRGTSEPGRLEEPELSRLLTSPLYYSHPKPLCQFFTHSP